MDFLYLVGAILALYGIVEGTASLDNEKSVTTEAPIDIAPHNERLLNDMWKVSSVARRNTPPMNLGAAVDVSYGMTLAGVKSVDVNTGLVELIIWEKMSWNDNRLSWASEDYGGITSIRVPSSMIWTPDIMTYNNYVSDDHKFRGEVYAIIFHSGDVLYIPPTTKEIMCDISDTADVASCEMKIGSWTYSENFVNLVFYNGEEKMDVTDVFKPNAMVKGVTNNVAVRNSKFYDCCPNEAYPDLTFSFDLALE